MKEKALNQINNNILALNTIKIMDCHNTQWIKQQLINKYHILLQYLKENKDIDMDKFCPIVKETNKEVEELIHKYSLMKKNYNL